MKKYKNKIISGILILLVIAISFFSKGNDTEEKNPPEKNLPVVTETAEPKKTEEVIINPTQEDIKERDEDKKSKQDEVEHKSVKEEAVISETVPEATENIKPSCTISVRCDTILNNISQLNPEKKGILPEDGIILSENVVYFNEGESAFDVLLREMKNRKIHLEFSKTPAYNSVYIEGIANIYEFDCGDLSGWMYKVNGEFTEYSSSLYMLKDGDKIEFLYSCAMGADIGKTYF